MSNQEPIPLIPLEDPILEENRKRLRNFFDQRTTPVGGRDGVQKVYGGQELIATVAASSVAAGSGDTRVAHRLGRVPQAIVWYEAIEVVTGAAVSIVGDELFGHPDGGFGANGGNQLAWNNREIFVRSNVASPGHVFRFVVT